MLRGATVVFDLDGTLVDTLPDIARAANAVLTETGCTPLPTEELRRFVGEGSRALLSRSFAVRGRLLDPAGLDRAYAAFIAHHLEHLADASIPYPGVIEALDALASAGALLAVCTNKPGVLAMGVLEALGMRHRFAFVAGGDTFPTRKPDPAPLLETVRRADGDPCHAVLVGDSGNRPACRHSCSRRRFRLLGSADRLPWT
jgi:phosphoglycolate phosphatase